MARFQNIPLLSIVFFYCLTSNGQQTGKAGPLSYSINGEEVYITDCDTTYSGDLIIPLKINDKYVTKISDQAFHICRLIESVVIPNSVTSIGQSAFAGCNSLSEIEIPDSVESIGRRAFTHCSSMTSFKMGNSVTSIGERLFWKCESLTSIVISDSVKSIGQGAFEDCTSLKSIRLPTSVTSIGQEAFFRCNSLTSVYIPDSVNTIELNAFSSTPSLVEIHIPEKFHTEEHAKRIGLYFRFMNGGFLLPLVEHGIFRISPVVLPDNIPAVWLTMETNIGLNYVIQKSVDLKHWENDGQPLNAISNETTIMRVINDTPVFFQLVEVE